VVPQVCSQLSWQLLQLFSPQVPSQVQPSHVPAQLCSPPQVVPSQVSLGQDPSQVQSPQVWWPPQVGGLHVSWQLSHVSSPQVPFSGQVKSVS
jgi:hypothetical protein